VADIDESVYLNAARAKARRLFINSDAAEDHAQWLAKTETFRAAMESVWRARGEHDAAAPAALRLIAAVGCTTLYQGSCRDEGSGRTPTAEYGADRWCSECIAQAGLDGDARLAALDAQRSVEEPQGRDEWGTRRWYRDETEGYQDYAEFNERAARRIIETRISARTELLHRRVAITPWQVVDPAQCPAEETS
jgi:hypothetical protein